MSIIVKGTQVYSATPKWCMYNFLAVPLGFLCGQQAAHSIFNEVRGANWQKSKGPMWMITISIQHCGIALLYINKWHNKTALLDVKVFEIIFSSTGW